MHPTTIDIFWYYLSTLAFLCVFGALLCVYRYYLGNRLIANANKLKSQMANIKQNFPELADKRSDLVASGLGSLGIDRILDEIGIDPSILKNPLVRGLIDKYAPRILESMNKNATNDKGTEVPLL